MSAQEGTGQSSDGFTLIELLVVMVVVGILAALASGALLTQRRKAQEASTKSDLRAIVKEIQTYYVDASGTLDITGDPTTSTWELAEGATVLAAGKLSDGNTVSLSSTVTAVDAYCVGMISDNADAKHFRATPSGLEVGDC